MNSQLLALMRQEFWYQDITELTNCLLHKTAVIMEFKIGINFSNKFK